MIKATALTTLLLISTLASSTSIAASVAGVSKESFAQYGKEDAYWVVTVSCDDDTQHIVQRKTDQDTWCPKGSDSLCSEDKEVAYKNACSEVHTQQAKKAQAAEAIAKRRALEKARAEAEEQRITQEIAAAEKAVRDSEQKLKNKVATEENLSRIEQERLALSKRQLEIEGRIIEINSLLEEDEEF